MDDIAATRNRIEPKRNAIVMEYLDGFDHPVVHIECKDRAKMGAMEDTARHLLYLINHSGLGYIKSSEAGEQGHSYDL